MLCDTGKRYGNLKNGVDDIKKCKWFAALDWELLLTREIPAPYKPQVKSATDTSTIIPPLSVSVTHRFRCIIKMYSIEKFRFRGNFEEYPDSDEEPPEVSAGSDPFADWNEH